MRTIAKGRQISIHTTSEKRFEKKKELLKMFNQAAVDVTREDLEERESLLGGFTSASN